MSAASVRKPASRRAATASRVSPASTTGRWNSEPAVARTHLGFVGSTERADRATPKAPAASATRIRAPALPGSDISWASTTWPGPWIAVTSASERGSQRQTATTPWGVCAEASPTNPADSTTCSATPEASEAAITSSRRSTQSSSTKISTTIPAVRASRTACGPSARNSPRNRRNFATVSCRASRTRADRALSTDSSADTRHSMSGPRARAWAPPPPEGGRGPRPTASGQAAGVEAGSAARAVSTSEANAASSFTASSASMRRSTSTPAAFRPWMNRL